MCRVPHAPTRSGSPRRCPGARLARMVDPGDHRIGDSERQQAIDLLRAHTGAGRLTLDEFSDLAGQVYAAQTYRELEAVARNLPPGLVPTRRRGAPPVRAARGRNRRPTHRRDARRRPRAPPPPLRRRHERIVGPGPLAGAVRITAVRLLGRRPRRPPQGRDRGCGDRHHGLGGHGRRQRHGRRGHTGRARRHGAHGRLVGPQPLGADRCPARRWCGCTPAGCGAG